MKLAKPVPLQQLADLLSAELIGNPEALVTGINEIHKV
jgi:UDP-3-O-[3-hydroxymyristoyl] glucosamine N-acyltransferase